MGHNKIILLSTPFQPSQSWVQIVVVMLFCPMLEINYVVLYCICEWMCQRRWIYSIKHNLTEKGLSCEAQNVCLEATILKRRPPHKWEMMLMKKIASDDEKQ